MATNLALEEALLEEALRISGLHTKKAAVTQALEEYIQRRRQRAILGSFGSVDFDPAYDHKAGRRRNPR